MPPRTSSSSSSITPASPQLFVPPYPVLPLHDCFYFYFPSPCPYDNAAGMSARACQPGHAWGTCKTGRKNNILASFFPAPRALFSILMLRILAEVSVRGKPRAQTRRAWAQAGARRWQRAHPAPPAPQQTNGRAGQPALRHSGGGNFQFSSRRPGGRAGELTKAAAVGS